MIGKSSVIAMRYDVGPYAYKCCTFMISGMVAMLLSVSLAFFILTTPQSVFFTIYAVMHNTTTARQDEQLELLRAIGFVMSQMNHAINFTLYILSGSRFRLELRNMLCKATK